MSFERILVPLDGSYLAERALTPALFIAEAISARLLFVRVAIPLSLNLDPQLYQSTIILRQNEAKKYLSGYGRSGIKRWVSGSVAEDVLRGANCVTLVIHGQEASK
ncbi:MAG: hypothetical protein JSW55_02005 [Chloroflexota bacterium]|nr:MAG: hypothetical protein JSW55_02005 [Chloroflexota bacterium]